MQPAEWEPHAACWVAWPCAEDLWLENLAPARRAWVAMARAIAGEASAPSIPETETLEVLVPDGEQERAAREALAGVEARFHRVPFGDIWLRDTAPIFVRERERRAWRRRGSGSTAGVESTCSSTTTRSPRGSATIAGLPELEAPWVLEGGSVDVDGEGTVPHDAPVPPQPEPQPVAWTRARSKRGSARRSGSRRSIWLGDGLLNDHTDGHVDNVARFVAPGVALCMEARSADDPNRDALDAIARELAAEHRRAGAEARGRADPLAGPRRGRRRTRRCPRATSTSTSATAPSSSRPTDAVGRRGRRADRRALPRAARGRRRRAGDPQRRRRVSLHHAAAAARGSHDRDETITVAAIQCPLGGSRDENVARVERHVREAAKKGAQVILPPELFEGPYFCRAGARVVLRLGATLRGQRDRRSASRGSRASSSVVDPRLVLRARRAGPLQQRRDDRRRRRGARRSTARATSPTAPATRRSSTSAPATPAFASWATKHGDGRRRHLLGPVVPRVRAGDDAARRGGPLLPDRDRLRAARPGARHARPVAARDDRARRLERRCRSWRRTASARKRGSLSTGRRSSPTRAATSSPSSGATTKGDRGDLRPRRSSGARGRRGASSAIAGPELYGVLGTGDGKPG